MKTLRLMLAVVFGFVLGAALFHTPAVKAQGRAKVQEVSPGGSVSGTPVSISCLPPRVGLTPDCYVLVDQ